MFFRQNLATKYSEPFIGKEVLKQFKIVFKRVVILHFWIAFHFLGIFFFQIWKLQTLTFWKKDNVHVAPNQAKKRDWKSATMQKKSI